MVNSLLSSGVLDWATRDAEVQVVIDILTVCANVAGHQLARRAPRC
jgi:hypothetical protein